MIITVTCNPSLDYVVKLDDLKVGEINRSQDETMMAGGKGINVSLVLTQLGTDTIATGFTAGFVGSEIEQQLKRQKVNTAFIRVEGNSRLNVKVRGKKETAINGSGPLIDEEVFHALQEQISVIKEDDILVLSGSIPSSLSKDTYFTLARLAKVRNAKCVVDAEGELLLNALQANPFLIKPNLEELSAVFSEEIPFEKIEMYARKLQEKGARNVLVSCGKDGAVLLEENGAYHTVSAKKITMVNSVGAGDSMVAGFLYGYCEKHDMQYALECGNAAGAASASSIGLCDAEGFWRMMEAV